MLPCLNKTLFGIECPGCGLQRSVALLLDGKFEAAFHMYPAIYSLILLSIFLLINIFITFKYQRIIKITLITINVLIVIISYIIKMSNLT
ncbi:DUF2752 domain-containing protein [Leptobacterium sp. I13]|uniref:DUF2752 domain-containing protein n=1 Tax=Leptobacterium meishanense TaxID=3128904 RepID=UPI0030EC6C54